MFKWRAWLFDYSRLFDEVLARERKRNRDLEREHEPDLWAMRVGARWNENVRIYSGLGSNASVHLFSSYFNHRMINGGVMFISISFNASTLYKYVQSLWPLLCYCCMTISVFDYYFGSLQMKPLLQQRCPGPIVCIVAGIAMRAFASVSMLMCVCVCVTPQTDLWFNLFVKDARTVCMPCNHIFTDFISCRLWMSSSENNPMIKMKREKISHEKKKERITTAPHKIQ